VRERSVAFAFHGGKTKTFGKYWYFESHMLNSLSFRGLM